MAKYDPIDYSITKMQTKTVEASSPPRLYFLVITFRNGVSRTTEETFRTLLEATYAYDDLLKQDLRRDILEINLYEGIKLVRNY